MFTVVICSKSFIQGVKNNYSYILDLISKNPDCAVCMWDTAAESYEDALPDLENIIAGKSKWRAVVVQDGDTFSRDFINKRNPFDVVGSLKVLQDFGEAEILGALDELSADENEEGASETSELEKLIEESARRVYEYRQKKADNYVKASKNPLARLGLWFYGIPTYAAADDADSWPEGLIEKSAEIDREYYSMLLENDILLSEVEQYRTMVCKREVLRSKFDNGARVEKKPESVIVIGERDADRAGDIFVTSAIQHEELEYSNFCDDNLYCDRMRFVFFDVNCENNIRSTTDYLSFVSLICVFAENEVPDGVLNAGRVYRSDAVMNKKAVKILFSRYLEKLRKTRMILMSTYRRQEEFREKRELSREQAQELFESEVRIPVIIREGPDRGEFMAEHKKIGLAKDCPQDEYQYWYHQVTNITKKFIRYLKEPRRALKTAVKTDFCEKNTIDDERIWQLNEFQRDDIQDKLLEQEQKMVETTTSNIFDTTEYTNRLDKADRDVRKKIAQRMTRNKTLAVSGIAIAAYLFGFITLLFENAINRDAFMTAMAVVGICLGAFALCGFIYILVMKKRLKDRIVHFNMEMSGILTSIDNTMRDFSTYLSHACNVMREFSVFNHFRQTEDRKLNILKKHIHDLEAKISQAKELVNCYNVDDSEFDEYVAPYNYDFSVMSNYIYDMPYTEGDKSIEFLLKGNIVDISIDYIDKVTITREELYD